MTAVLLYTSNQHKISEISHVFSDVSVDICLPATMNVETGVAETGQTFVENALIKARDGCKKTNLPCLADDSGLWVDKIKAPGLYSSRYAGDHATSSMNMDKLLDALKPIPKEGYKATFYCCLVLLRSVDDPLPLIAEATWSGMVIGEKKGSNGFGYDPIFYLPELGKTAAELNPQIKQQISHRGQALKAMKSMIQLL
tara:strand:+ start:13 stop:606 length:594 start_codon:yes stop_codon:yes gene_type:complete